MHGGCLAVWLLFLSYFRLCSALPLYKNSGMRSPHSKASTIPKRAHKGMTSDVTHDILQKSHAGEKPWSTVTRNSAIPQNFWQVKFKLRKTFIFSVPTIILISKKNMLLLQLWRENFHRNNFPCYNRTTAPYLNLYIKIL
jgi:hypothetical protein